MIKTIRKRVFLSYALPILLSLLLVVGLCYGLISHYLQAAEQEKLVISAVDQAHRITFLLEERMAILSRVETLDYRRNFRELALAAHMAKFADRLPVLSYLNSAGQEEVKVVNGQKASELRNHAGAPLFVRAMERKNQIVIGEIEISPELGQPCLPLAVARFNYFGDEFAGVLRAEIPLADLAEHFKGPTYGRNRSDMILLDAQGTPLYQDEQRLRFLKDFGAGVLPDGGDGEGAAPAALGLIEIPGVNVLVGRAVVTRVNWSVLTALPYTAIMEPVIRLAWCTLFAALLALGLSLLLAQRISRPLLRNLGRVVEHAHRIGSGDFYRKLEMQEGDEFAALAAALNKMTDDIGRAMHARDALRNILQSIMDPLVLLDAEFRVVDVNPAATKLMVTHKESLMGQLVTRFLAATEDEAGQILAIASDSGPLHNHETLLRISSGNSIPVLLSCSQLAEEAAEIRWVVILKDISALRQAEKGRRQALVFNETLLERAPVGIRVFDGVSGCCVRANTVAAEIAGGSVKALIGQNFRQMNSWRQAQLVPVAERVLKDGEAKMIEMDMTTTFDKHLTVRYFLSRFLVEERYHLLVIGQDITEEKRLAEKSRQVESQMLHVQKLESLGLMAGGIAHDFNNILMAVMGYIDLALLEVPGMSPAVNSLQEIKKAARRAADLAGQMLAYSGRGKFDIGTVDLNSQIESMLPMLQISAGKHIDLHFLPGTGMSPIEADVTQIQQVIMNMVINAAEATGEIGGKITIVTGSLDCEPEDLQNIWIREPLAKGRYVFCEIADHGCGMDEETVSRIFDPFFTTKFTGRGLGMAAALGIVSGHKGSVKVTSEVGGGTTFRILLPASPKVPHADEKVEQVGAWRGQGKVLLVDDEISVREVGRKMLRALGFEVVTAADGQEALDVFRQEREHISLVLMDLTMPNMGGEEACRELRRLEPQLKVVLSSGYDREEVGGHPDVEGLAGFLKKPYQLDELRALLRTVWPENVSR